MPPTPSHPPPAPDWILGEDGHWKPPPFTSGGGPRPAPGPAPGPPPDPGPGRDGGRRSVSGWLGMRRRDVFWGVLGLLVIGVGLASRGMALVELVRGPEDPPTRVEASLDAEALATLGPDGDPVCPSVDLIGALSDQTLPPEIQREGFDRTVNEVAISGIECRYGDVVRLGKLDGYEDRVHRLRTGTGPTEIRDGPFPGSVRYDDVEAGTATIVYQDDRAEVESFVQLPIELDTYLIALAEAALN